MQKNIGLPLARKCSYIIAKLVPEHAVKAGRYYSKEFTAQVYCTFWTAKKWSMFTDNARPGSYYKHLM